MAEETLASITEQEKALAARKNAIYLSAMKAVRPLFDAAAINTLTGALTDQQANVPTDTATFNDFRNLLLVINNVKGNLDREIARIEPTASA